MQSEGVQATLVGFSELNDEGTNQQFFIKQFNGNVIFGH